MKLSRPNLVLAVFLLLVVVASLFMQVDHSRPNLQIYLGDDMTYSPAYGAYDRNENFADGRTAQPPVPGTIARGEMPIHFEATPEGALRAGEQLKNPYAPLSDEARTSAQRGAEALPNILHHLSRRQWSWRWPGQQTRLPATTVYIDRQVPADERRTAVPHPHVRSGQHASVRGTTFARSPLGHRQLYPQPAAAGRAGHTVYTGPRKRTPAPRQCTRQEEDRRRTRRFDEAMPADEEQP